jgi:hypothetical protein
MKRFAIFNAPKSNFGAYQIPPTFNNVDFARRFIAGSDMVIVYGEKAIAEYMRNYPKINPAFIGPLPQGENHG